MNAPARQQESAASAAATSMLETRGLCSSFGALAVTRDVSLSLASGARHALIGPNGVKFASRISVLAEGTPDEIARDPRVRATYLGSGHV